MSSPLTSRVLPSPVGELTLVASPRGLRAILWEDDDPARAGLAEQPTSGDDEVLDEAARQLGAFFRGERDDFDLPLDLQGTDFQVRVWEALTRIPFGTTRTYGDLAAELDRPTAARAVGAAVGRNPVSVVVPCHRVVGSDGSLTGFAGGMANKRWLLEHEGAITPTLGV